MAGEARSVKWFFFRIMQKIPGWHFFFSLGLLFRSLKGNWPLFGETTKVANFHRWIPKVGGSASFWGQTPQATKPWAVCKGHVVQKGHRKCHFFRVPPKKPKKVKIFWLGNSHPITHVLDPWWSHIGVCGDHPQDCWSTKSCASLDG